MGSSPDTDSIPKGYVKLNYGLGMLRDAGSTLAAFSSHRVQAKFDSSASNTAFDSAPVLPDSK